MERSFFSVSHRGRVFGVMGVRLFPSLPRGISRLTPEMTTCQFGFVRLIDTTTLPAPEMTTVRFAAKPSVGRDALVPPHNVYDRFCLCRGGFLGAEPARASIWGNECTTVSVSTAGDLSAVSHRGHLAGAYMFRAVSYAGDFSTNARNDNVSVWFYSVNRYDNVTRARNDDLSDSRRSRR